MDEKMKLKFAYEVLANMVGTSEKFAREYRAESNEGMALYCEGKSAAYVLACNLLIDFFDLDVERLSL